MPVTIQPTTLKYRNGNGFTSADCIKGDPGVTPDISIGTVTTGAAGSSASATMTGTPEAPVLNMTIPRGDTGSPGDPTTLIDDTAGAGDTDKTWSADKLAENDTAYKSALNQKYEKPSTGIPASDLADSYIEEPSSDGTNGQVLTTDGNGGRSWTTVQGGGLPDTIPTEETAQELLEYETYNTGLTDTALAVIGQLFTNLPQDETLTDILHSLELECERLDLIYNGWIAERESA